MPDFFLIEVSSGVIFIGQREYHTLRVQHKTLIAGRRQAVLFGGIFLIWGYFSPKKLQIHPQLRPRRIRRT